MQAGFPCARRCTFTRRFISQTLLPRSTLSQQVLSLRAFSMSAPVESKAPEQPQGAPAAAAPTEGAAPKGPSKNELKKMAKEAEKEKKRIEREAREAEQKAARAAADVDYATENYGKLPLHQSQSTEVKEFAALNQLSAADENRDIFFRARIHNSRAQGAKMAFLELRQGVDTIQALVTVEPEKVSKHMVKWAESLPRESLVLVQGTVQKPKDLVKSTTVQDAEIKINQIHLESEVTASPPFGLEDASRSEADLQIKNADGLPKYARVDISTRMESRPFDLRTAANQSIFRISSGVCNLFRDYLNSQGFIEIHTPKLQGAATESGASVFKVDYFQRPAFLAQSPQLAKQMCIAADMNRVYEIGPVFRAENSNTHRHMTEFTGLDLEMALNNHYHEAIFTLDGMFKAIFEGLQQKYGKDIDTVRKQYDCQPFTWLPDTLVLRFPDAVKMLRNDGIQVEDYEDFSTPVEKRLGELVKQEYKTDYFILDKFPSAVRPFYTMASPDDPRLSNSYDFFMRGEEVLSGAQRVHDAPLLEKNMRAVGIDPDAPGMKEYVDAFRWGCPPHAGGGIGLERVVMLFLKLGNIRLASLYPRDPRSFASIVGQEQLAATQASA